MLTIETTILLRFHNLFLYKYKIKGKENMSLFLNDYEFQEDLNYLIYFRGGMAPPTRGHFSLVESFISYPNVKYFIHQIGKRHGIPYPINRKIFKLYIRELLSQEMQERIILKRMGSSLDVLEHIENIDVVIYIKGREEDVEEDYRDLKKRYKPLISKLKKRGIPLHFLIIDRPLVHKLSATKFVEALSRDSAYKMCNLKYFIPRGLSYESISYIFSTLKKYVS